MPKSLTLTTGSDIKLHLRGAAGFKCIQMSEETLQVLHVVDLLESTEGKSDLSYDPILGKNVIKIKNLFT